MESRGCGVLKLAEDAGANHFGYRGNITIDMQGGRNRAGSAQSRIRCNIGLALEVGLRFKSRMSLCRLLTWMPKRLAAFA